MKYPVNNLHPYDLEVYPNFFLAGFMVDGEVHQFDINSLDKLRAFVKVHWTDLVGFNSNHYDDVVLCEFLREGTPQAAYEMSKRIIEGGLKRWDTNTALESVDLINVLPGRKSLKKLGVILAHDRLQELPFDPHQDLTHNEMEEIRGYNINDLVITAKLRDSLMPELELRAAMSEQYNIDLRSKGEAQIAETVLVTEAGATKKTLKEAAWENVKITPTFRIQPPSWWAALGVGMQEYISLGKVSELGLKIMTKDIPLHGGFIPSGTLDQTFYIGDRYYALGVGGLHSVDGAGSWVPDATRGEFMSDWDVASYYPSMILEEGLSPAHWGKKFLPIYRNIVERRLAAKAAGDKTTADVLKIVANGSFGKFGDQYSALFDPVMLAHVTVYGQLGLLVLIAMLTDKGHRVVSANTDGVTVISQERPDEIIRQWEQLTRMTLEEVPYAGLYQQNVNNYIAVTQDNEIKAKGRLSCKRDLRHMPGALICAKAVQAYLKDGTHIIDTIRNETDIHMFLLTASVNRDWSVTCGRKKMGRVLRWYKSNAAHTPELVKRPGPGAKGNQGIIPDSENGVPVDNLPDGIPDDLDIAWYLCRADDMLNEITHPKTPMMNAEAEALYDRGLMPNIVSNKTQLSRARVGYGEVDFDSIAPGQHMVVQTGNGLMGKMRDGVLECMYEILTTPNPDRKTEYSTFPTRTRAKVEKDHGFKLIYGANVPVAPWGIQVERIEDVELDQYYTPAELKKVRE